MNATYQSHMIVWQGITIELRWAPQWMNSDICSVAHLELISEGRVPLPVTETGYRSHFTSREAVEAHGGPVEFAAAWLDHEAQSEAWQRHAEQSKQLSLF